MMWKCGSGLRKPSSSRMGVIKWRCHGDETTLHFKTITALQKKRLESLKGKLRKDVTLYSRYNEVVEDYLKQGMADDLPGEHTSPPSSQIYYLPHHTIMKEDKVTTKLQDAVDALYHEDGSPSLND